MKVSRSCIAVRGLSNACPNCGAHSLFKSGTLFQLNDRCPACQFTIIADHNDGFQFRAVSLNFGVTVALVLIPILSLAAFGRLTATLAEVISIVGIVALPFLLYRPTCSWCLAYYFVLFPADLPANRTHPADSPKA